MKKRVLLGLVSISLAFGFPFVPSARAQSPYFQAVTNLNPIGYWPMHEVAAPAPGDIETNLGTLGALANGYYADWIPMTPLTTHQVAGALAGDPDTAAAFNGAKNAGGQTYLLVPKTSPAMTIKPPFTVEAWAFPSNNTYADMVSQFGFAQNGANTGARYGFRLIWDGKFHLEFGTSGGSAGAVGLSHTAGAWYHVVVTCDGINGTVWVNGAPEITAAVNPNWDPALPLTVGNGFWSGNGPQRAYNGAVDEVAVYPSVLPDAEIQKHYNVGTGTDTSTTYKNAVLAGSPLVYLRMDGPAYTAPARGTWPVLTNYGSIALNGAYSPGSIPGAVAGPNVDGVPYGGMDALNVMPGNGMSSYATAGYDPAFNPTTSPFSYGAWFRGNPADSRSYQTIMGHSDSSWRAAINNTGKLQVHGSGAPDLTSPVACNDGLWHQFIVTAFPSNSVTLVPGTNILYVDGSVVASNLSRSIDAGTNADVILGNDPQFLNGTTIGRSFAGQMCEAAFWSRVLSPDEVKVLWNAAGVPPGIKTQPVTASVNQGSTFTNTVAVIGSEPLAYQWYQNGTQKSGQTAANLVLDPVQSADTGSYYVVVTNNYGSATSSVCQLTVVVRPTILAQVPVTYTNLYTLYAGSSPEFALTSVSGAAPFSYQWYTNGVADVSGTNATYQLRNVQVGWVTNYCVVTNVAGSASSFTWVAVVVPPPTAPYPQSVLSLKPLGYWRLNEADNNLMNGNPGAIAHDYVGGNDGVYTNVTLGQQGYSLGLANQYFNPNLATDPVTTSAQFGSVATTDSGALSVAGVDFSAPTNTSQAFSVAAWVSGGSTQPGGAGLVTKGYGNGGEQFNLDVYNKVFRFFVRDAAGGVHTATSTNQLDTFWHHVVGVCDEPNGTVSVYVDGVLSGQGAIIPGTGVLGSTNLVSIGARKSNATTNVYDLAFAGYMNDVAIYGSALSAAQVTSNYVSAGVAPRATQHPPATVTVAEGGTLTLAASGIGTLPLALQWQSLNNPALVVNQTNATLVISNVPLSMNYDSFFLRVTNIYGSADSAYSTVTVISGPPQITVSNLPAQVLLPLGKSYTYSVEAVGTMPFTYQWKRDGLTVGLGSSCAVTAAALGSSTVTVAVNNSQGTATGSSLLTVIPMVNDSYAASVLALRPVGYWPLQESVTPAPVTMETNLGTLGRLGNAYYAMNAGASPRVTFGQGGALTASGDFDPAVQFSGPSGTNYAFVPHATSALTMQAPLTYEVWLNSSSTAFCDIMGQGGSGVNSPSSGGSWRGIRMSYGGNNGGGPNLQVYAYTGGNNTYNSFATPAGSLPFGVWHHCVMTFDGTTCILYIDGQALASNSNIAAMVPDSCTPLTIGEGRWVADSGGPTRSFNGVLDEVAVYPAVLSALQVTNHYTAGITAGGNYRQTVLNDQPLLYYRMNASAYIDRNPGLYPTAVNYGSAPVNAVYPGGVVPGGVAGPTIAGLSSSLAAPINGDISCVDAGSDPAFNPTDLQPFSAMLWFKGYPADGRVQTLMSHGVNNWAMNLDGTIGRVVWNLYAGGNITSTNILNDGNWHMLVGVSDGTAHSLYVDGALNASGAQTAGLTGEPGGDLLLGGHAGYTSVGINQRFFAGALAQAAVFTNALSAQDIQNLWSQATVVPRPTISLNRVGGNLVITYTGTLLSSTNVNDAYTPVAGASPPTYTVPQTDAQRFYRSSNP